MKRTSYFDALNVFACISVVALHCNGYVHSFAHNGAWAQCLAVEVILFAAVPLFFMLSGATLLNYPERYTHKSFLKKRFQKTIVPYIIFSTILFWGTSFLHSPFELNNVFQSYLRALFTGNVPWANYWFFIPLFLYYLFLPFLSKIAQQSTTKELFALICLMFFFLSAVPIFNELFNFSISKNIPVAGYSLYAFLGYFLSRNNFENHKHIFFAMGFLALVSLGLRYFFVFNAEGHSDFWFSYFGIYAFFPATFIFLLFKKFGSSLNKHPKVESFLQKLSSYSFGIYLIHGIILHFLPFPHASLLFRLAGIPITYILCCFIVALCKRFKISSWLVP